MVGPVAHGGHCVARVDGRVIFVRHAIPGERVMVRVTEGTEGDGFWRADAVEVLEPSPDRVVAPCRYAGPDACGGCDFQHVDLARQRLMKGEVVAEQLRRLAHLDVEVQVEAVPGDQDGLHWRTRQRYVDLGPGADGARIGMRKHRSHDVVEIDDCLLAGPTPSYVVGSHTFDVADGGFWQVHPGAPDDLVDTVLDFLGPRTGESALDLYGGVGLFARFLADAVGGEGRVTLVEGDPAATACAIRNVPEAEVLARDVREALEAGAPETVDLVVLDPPREGAKRRVVELVAARSPRAVAYVACDPAALARDLALFAEHGYRLDRLRALDLFPMTHHLECVALLTPEEVGG